MSSFGDGRVELLQQPMVLTRSRVAARSIRMHSHLRRVRLNFAVLFGVFALLQLWAAHGEKVVVVAGGGTSVTGLATDCRLHEPFGVEFDPAGNLFIVEMEKGQRVLKVDRRGTLHIVAGSGEKGDGGDGGPAVQGTFNGMHNLAIGPNGDIYLADTWNNRVRKIDPKTGLISSFAATGKKSFSGDGGLATNAEFGSVINVA